MEYTDEFRNYWDKVTNYMEYMGVEPYMPPMNNNAITKVHNYFVRVITDLYNNNLSYRRAGITVIALVITANKSAMEQLTKH